MRICLVSKEYPPETHVGGIGSYTHKTAIALARLGNEVHVVTSANKPPAEYLEDGVHVHRFSTRYFRPHDVEPLLHAREVAAHIAALPDPVDVVQACEYGAEALWYALMPRRAPLVTRFATPHWLVRKLNNSGQSGFLYRDRLIEVLERIQSIRSDGIIAPSQAMADVMCKAWSIAPERVTVVPSGMAPRVVGAEADMPAPPRLREGRYILYFGRLEVRKGVHVLAEALPSVLAAHPDLQAVFVGEDMYYQGAPMSEYVRRTNSDNVDRLVFVPRLSHAELFPIVRGATVVVLPSLWENLAHVCLESMQLGKPVIATRHCAFEEMIEDGVSGFLAEPGNAPDLARVMLDALSDGARLQRVGAEAQRQVARYDLDAMVQRLLEYYQQLSAKWRGARRLRHTSRTADRYVEQENAAQLDLQR